MTWLRKFASVGKVLLALIAVLILVFTIGHFGLQYGIGLGEVPKFLARTWLIWFIVRWAMYAVSGWFLWKMCKMAKNQDDLTACKRLIRVAAIVAITIEVVVFSRILGG